MPSSNTSSAGAHLIGPAFVLLAAIGFSAKAILVKLAYVYRVDAVTLLTLRMLLSLPLFLLMAWWSQRQGNVTPLTRREWLLVCVMGLAGYYLASLFDFLGLQYISAGLERLILFLNPTIVVLISAAFFHRAVTRRDVIALVLSYAGVALVFWHDLKISPEGRVVLGSLLVLASAVSYAVYLTGSGRLIHKLGTLRYTAYASIVSCLAIIVQFMLTRGLGELAQPLPVYGYSVVMALFSTALPILLMSEGIRRIGSSRTAMIATIGPILTIGLGYVFLDEAITLPQVTGALLVLAGVAIITLKK
ncbi:MAG: DMT family transporter [Burkholderiales bacterium]|nr:DMT family transporter [Burkholderiales bacterium]